MAENLVFLLPESLEDTLWSVTVLLQYLSDRLDDKSITGKREAASITVVSKFTELHEFLLSCWPHMLVLDKPIPEVVDRADMVFEFDPDSTYRLTCAVEKHIVESYGIKLGALPSIYLPPVAMEIGLERPGHLLVVERSVLDRKRDWVWEYQDEFIVLAEKAGATVGVLGKDQPWEEMRGMVSTASVVVGVRGTATLLAATMGKIVMELSPDELEHKNWASKFENRKVRMIYGKLKEMPAAWVWEKTEAWVKQVLGVGKEDGQRLRSE